MSGSHLRPGSRRPRIIRTEVDIQALVDRSLRTRYTQLRAVAPYVPCGGPRCCAKPAIEREPRIARVQYIYPGPLAVELSCWATRLQLVHQTAGTPRWRAGARRDILIAATQVSSCRASYLTMRSESVVTE